MTSGFGNSEVPCDLCDNSPSGEREANWGSWVTCRKQEVETQKDLAGKTRWEIASWPEGVERAVSDCNCECKKSEHQWLQLVRTSYILSTLHWRALLILRQRHTTFKACHSHDLIMRGSNNYYQTKEEETETQKGQVSCPGYTASEWPS